jgi:DNA-binding Lrp family transcriptional regulator
MPRRKSNKKSKNRKLNNKKSKNGIKKVISDNTNHTKSSIKDTSNIVLSLGKRAPVDAKDVELIKILMVNGRLSNVEIANMLNSSEATIRRRIQTLRDRGFIRGFTVLLDYKHFGQVVKAHINMQVKKKGIEKMAKFLTDMENSCTVYRVIGDYNLISMMVFKNIAELQEFIDQISEIETVEKLDYHLVTGAFKSCPLTGI